MRGRPSRLKVEIDDATRKRQVEFIAFLEQRRAALGSARDRARAICLGAYKPQSGRRRGTGA